MKSIATLLRGPVLFDRYWTFVAAGAMLLAGVALAILNEANYVQQKQREMSVQTQILSASVAPALMFNSPADAQDYLNALGANPDLRSAAVYNISDARVAAFHREDASPPPERAPEQTVRVESPMASAAAPVMRDGEMLGTVFVQVRTETLWQRVLRYAGVAVLIGLAALVVIVVGLAHQALSRANQDLAANAEALRGEIAERKKTEEALLQSRKMEAIGQLTGGIAHDFNNLLMVVISGLRMLDRHDDPERRSRTMEAMRQAAERGAVLMRQLLAFSRRQTLELETIDVGRQLKAMRPLLERSLRGDILVEIAVPDDLWSVRTDATQLELAVLNLALNARDAMPRGGVLTITAENAACAEGDGDCVNIVVQDTGVGIPPDLLERVLEPYFTTKQAGQGTGLGLSQVYGFMRQSGGDLHIDSVVNEGTRVTLCFPRSAEPAKRAPAIASGAIESHAPHARVLLVEDEDNVADMIGAMLQQMGHQSTRAAEAKSALETLSASRAYDVVLSDVIMPGEMNGAELAREVRARYPELPIVLMSGYSGQQTAAPDFPMLRKPFQAEELDRALAAALASRKVHKLA